MLIKNTQLGLPTVNVSKLGKMAIQHADNIAQVEDYVSHIKSNAKKMTNGKRQSSNPSVEAELDAKLSSRTEVMVVEKSNALDAMSNQVLESSNELTSSSRFLAKTVGGLFLGAGVSGTVSGSSGGTTTPNVGSIGGNTAANGIDASISDVFLYTSNQVETKNAHIKDLLPSFDSNHQGSKWGKAIGSGATLSYGFAVQNTSNYAGEYAQSGTSQATYKSGMTSFSSVQKGMALESMNAYASVSNLKFVPHTGSSDPLQADDTASHTGDIRWANTKNMPDYSGYSYYPDWINNGHNSGTNGDIWIAATESYLYTPNSDWAKSYVQFLLTHELGHALGLSHPHETSINLASEDSIKYSVMSYFDYVGQTSDSHLSQFYPSSMMLNDIAAIQYLYGVNTKFHTEDNVYSWDRNAHVFETIYDAGGNDTIDASTQLLGVNINLNPGTFSSIGVAFSNGIENVRDNLALAYAVNVNGTVINLIENAIGSVGDDVLIGNSANNQLSGGAGMDVCTGGLGADLFMFDADLDLSNIDHITDFSSIQGDKLVLDSSIFDLLDIGQLSELNFEVGDGLNQGRTVHACVVYDSVNGHVYYDADGNGVQMAQCVFVLDNLVPLSASDFIII